MFDIDKIAKYRIGSFRYQVGASAAAYYLAVLLALMYYALVLPLPSSFYKREAGRATGERLWRLSSCTQHPPGICHTQHQQTSLLHVQHAH